MNFFIFLFSASLFIVGKWTYFTWRYHELWRLAALKLFSFASKKKPAQRGQAFFMRALGRLSYFLFICVERDEEVF